MPYALWLLASLAQAACPTALSAEALDRKFEAAESAWAALDGAGFKDQTDALSLDLPCVDAKLSAALAARYHRLVGLRSFSDGDNALALGAFKAARAADPGYAFPEGLVPPGHAIRELYGQPLGKAETAKVPRPSVGWVVVDGIDADVYVPSRPTVFQHLTEDGAPITSLYRLPGDPWPEYPGSFVVSVAVPRAVPVPAPALEPVAAKPPRKGSAWPARITLGVVGLGAGIGAAVVYGQASASAKAFDEGQPDWTLKDLQDQRTKTNTLVGASAGLAALGLTSLTVAVVIR